MGGCWRELMTTLGVTSHATTAYHPQCNGSIERMHRQLKGAIRARLQDSNWIDWLPLVLLGLRSAWREGPDAAPSQLLYGSILRIPGEFLSTPEIINTSLNQMSSFLIIPEADAKPEHCPVFTSFLRSRPVSSPGP